MGYVGSSPSEKCTCGCTLIAHILQPQGCLVHGVHAFVPADAETADPEAPPKDCPEGGKCRSFQCASGCRRAADELSDEHREPEAPECKYPGGCPLESDVCPPGKSCAFDSQLGGIAMMPRPKAASLRRPPYAVAYEIGDGRMYEVALPGDAVATAEEGVLKISHPQGVAHIIQVKPMGEQ